MKTSAMKTVVLILLLPLVHSDSGETAKPINIKPEPSSLEDNDLLLPSSTSLPSLPEEETCVVEGERTMKVGEVIIPDPPKCYKIICHARDIPIFEGCASIKVGKNCHGSFYDMTKTYPNCCPNEVCP